MQVTVFTRTTCGPCRTLKHWFKSRGISFEEKNVDDDPDLVDKLISETGYQIVPTTFINGQTVMGINIPRIKEILESPLPAPQNA